jgi:acyl-CoA synthetase (AMP-forming)/AMP-acid ligase II
MNLVDPILFQARYHGPTAALISPGREVGVMSYRRLGLAIHGIAHRMTGAGLAPGNVVGLLIDDPILHVAIMLGLAHAGIVTFSMRPQAPPGELQVDAIIATGPLPFPFRGRLIMADHSLLEPSAKPYQRQRETGGADETCRLVLTSGTTGDSKAIAFTNQMLFERVGRTELAYGYRLAPCSRIFCDLTQTTALGYQLLIHVLWRGGTFIFSAANFDAHCEAISRYNIQCWVAAPSALANLLKLHENTQLDVQADLIISAGSLLSKSLSDRIRARLCSNVIAGYGSTEATIVATAPAQAINGIPNAVGFITPGMTVESVDDADKPLPPGHEGIIRIKSQYGATGYFRNEQESAKSFRDGWFYPGDLGCLTSDGMLRITGRQNFVLNIGGDKVRPELIEDVITAILGIDQAAAFTIVNELGLDIIHVVVTSTVPLALDAIKTHCEKHLPQRLWPATIVQVASLPLNEMGKLDRSRLREQFGKPSGRA